MSIVTKEGTIEKAGFAKAKSLIAPIFTMADAAKKINDSIAIGHFMAVLPRDISKDIIDGLEALGYEVKQNNFVTYIMWQNADESDQK